MKKKNISKNCDAIRKDDGKEFNFIEIYFIFCMFYQKKTKTETYLFSVCIFVCRQFIIFFENMKQNRPTRQTNHSTKIKFLLNFKNQFNYEKKKRNVICVLFVNKYNFNV